MGLSPEACVDVHGQVVQLSQRAHVAEQQHDDAPALDCLDRARQQIWRQGLKILQPSITPFRVCRDYQVRQ